MILNTPIPKTALFRRHNFCSDIEKVHIVLTKVRKELEAAAILTDHIASAEIVLAEAINNIIEHAYKFEKNHRIELNYKQRTHSITFMLTDQGKSMTSGRIPTPTLPVDYNEMAEIPEGGFGWGLIHDLTSEISYERRDDKNHLALTMKLS